MQVCPNCGEENSERARFCQACAHPLVQAAAPRQERKVVSVLFVDLVDFTSRSERVDPEDVSDFLRPYYDRVRGELERVGGTVEKFIGDAVVGIFGAPIAYGDDAERAVRAALAVRDAIRDMNTERPELDLRARLAVNTGEAIVLLGANPTEGQGMVAGDVINTASRLQSAAPVGSVLVGPETYAATRNVIAYEAAEPVQAKGKALAIPTWVAVGTRGPAGERSLSGVPMVGRGTELAIVRSLWEQVAEQSRPHLLSVFGFAGIGKSRLAHELSRRVEATDGLALRGRTLPYGESSPYAAFAQQVKQVAGIFDNDAASASHEKLREAFANVVPEADADEAERNLAMLVGLPSDAVAEDRDTLFFSARLLVEGLAAQRPTMLVFEDIHWADDSLLDLVEFLADRVRGVPLLLVALARPELLSRRESWGGGLPASTVLRLEPLPPTEATELTRRLLVEQGLRDVDARAEDLAGVTDGNPLFIEEVVASMVERVTAMSGELPTSVRGIVSARLDALPPPERAVLMDAAVVGKVFWLGALERLDPDREDLGRILGNLERRDMIHREAVSRIRGEQQFVFKHVLIRDVAYQTLPRPERRRRHAEVARFLEEVTPQLGDAAAALAHHWKEAGEPERAAGYVVAAAEQAGRGWAKERAMVLYREALELVGSADPALRKDILRRQAVMAQAVYHLPEARRLWERNQEEPAAPPD
jgi:class 3 adenylate cyclase